MQKVGSFRLELDHDGIAELLRSQPLADECEAAASRIAAAAGDGFEVRGPRHTGQRAAYSVYAATNEAKAAEATDKALTVAVQSCRA
ncbi:hypothetical protein [Olsenella uli]|uniref:hypothetical protein n=1 Tax=Olsenella uli TaxID=133926 RepID=UPI00241F0D8E|nr:hypothetical protein [Olsenella uli]